MSLAVVDTSVAHKWIAGQHEQGAEEAFAALEAHHAGECLLAAPSLILVELANSIRCARHVPAEQGSLLVESLPGLHLDLYGVNIERINLAVRLSYLHKLSVYDALFLQLAQELDCPLVTADRRAFKGLDCGVEIRLI